MRYRFCPQSNLLFRPIHASYCANLGASQQQQTPLLPPSTRTRILTSPSMAVEPKCIPSPTQYGKSYLVRLLSTCLAACRSSADMFVCVEDDNKTMLATTWQGAKKMQVRGSVRSYSACVAFTASACVACQAPAWRFASMYMLKSESCVYLRKPFAKEVTLPNNQVTLRDELRVAGQAFPQAAGH